MSRYRRNQPGFMENLKDYFVPIIGGILLLLIFWSFFSKNEEDTSPSNTQENQNPININFLDAQTEAFIVYADNKKEAITSNTSLYKGESIIVKEGKVTLSSESYTDITLNKIAEFEYKEADTYALYSSDAWIKNTTDTRVEMRYANIEIMTDSVVSLTQNEAVSTIYVLQGSAKVSNLGGSSTSVGKGQKLAIERQDTAKTDVDLGSERSSIDSYFQSSDWFIENEGYRILQKSSEDSGDTLVSGDSGKYISFDNIRDEMNTDEAKIDISGESVADTVGSVSIGNQEAIIGSDSRFVLEDIQLQKGLNDLVIKIYDTQKNILEKKVVSVYSSSSSNTSAGSSSSGGSSFQASTNFAADATDFGFTDPSVTGKFSTSNSEITIRGITTAKDVTSVEVNGFELSSFNGSTWRYHAFTRFDTLQDGSNQYKIDYLKDGRIIYTDYYTIVKKSPEEFSSSTSTSSKDSETLQDKGGEDASELEEDSQDTDIEEPETAL